jgi:hypothetical protein
VVVFHSAANCMNFAASLCITARDLLVLSSLFLLTACEAQKPGASGAGASATAASATSAKPQSFSEPALIGKVIDEATKRPIEGALIYGHYATTSGTLVGGTKFGALIKSFEVVTDANGDFKLEAWSATEGGGANHSATIGNKFPVIAVWKPGYALEVQQLSGITQFRSRSNVSGGGSAKISKEVVDWSAFPYELKPVTSEIDRYDALNDASYPMMMAGECGWESYSRVLLAQHVEWKALLRRSFPSSELDADGYSLGRYNHPDRTLRASQSNRSALDKLMQKSKSISTAWTCKDPAGLVGNIK